MGTCHLFLYLMSINDNTGFKITVGNRTISDQNKELSDQMQKTPVTLCYGKKFEAKLNVRPDYASIRP